MGFLDGILGGALGNILGGATGQSGQVPSQSGGLGSGMLIQLVLQLMQQSGGLPGLLEKFKRAGLGQQAASWVSSGANEAVSPDQVNQALGPDVLNQLASQSGMDQAQVSQGLAQLLPNLVNQLTPDGSVPENHHSLIEDGLQALLKRGLG